MDSSAVTSHVKQAYQKKLLSQVDVVRIEAIGEGGLRHHAVLLCEDEEVFHCPSDECEAKCTEVKVEPLEDFTKRFVHWQAYQLPESVDHAQEIRQLLHRLKTRREGEENLLCRQCCNRHFAECCFEGQVKGEKPATGGHQALFHAVNVLTSLKTAVVAGMSAACCQTTTNIRTARYLLGRIPIGSITTKVPIPYMGRLAATGLGTGVFVGSVAVGLVWQAAVNLYATRFNAHLAASCLPICVCNSTDKEVNLQLRSVGSGVSLSNLVQWGREWCGAGCRTLMLAAGAAGELNPPCDEATASRFLLVAFTKNKDREATSLEVRRGDVIVWNDDGLTQVQLDEG